ncbi:MAG: hypothetical protein AB4290_02325 [Spirulina sp.]
MRKTIEQLEFSVENIKEFSRDLLSQKNKVFDLEDPNRPSVSKARHSNEIHPLTLGEAIEAAAFPERSQEHIWQLIPLYLDLLYTPENVSFPSIQQLDLPIKVIP